MKKYGFIKRLVDKITRSETNCEFDYYNHKVVSQSGTKGYVSVNVYNTTDRYSGTLLSFNFDYWTRELHFVHWKNKQVIVKAFDAFNDLYECIKVYFDKDNSFDETSDETENVLI